MNSFEFTQFSNQKPIPRLWAINLFSEDGKSLYNYIGIAFNEQEVYEAAMRTMRETSPDVYERGQSTGGFKIVTSQSLTYTQVQRMFRTKIEQEPKIELIVDEETEVNKLIKRIIATKDTDLLEKSMEKLNDFEILYIKDAIK